VREAGEDHLIVLLRRLRERGADPRMRVPVNAGPPRGDAVDEPLAGVELEPLALRASTDRARRIPQQGGKGMPELAFVELAQLRVQLGLALLRAARGAHRRAPRWSRESLLSEQLLEQRSEFPGAFGIGSWSSARFVLPRPIDLEHGQLRSRGDRVPIAVDLGSQEYDSAHGQAAAAETLDTAEHAADCADAVLRHEQDREPERDEQLRLQQSLRDRRERSAQGLDQARRVGIPGWRSGEQFAQSDLSLARGPRGAARGCRQLEAACRRVLAQGDGFAKRGDALTVGWPALSRFPVAQSQIALGGGGQKQRAERRLAHVGIRGDDGEGRE
jgi:hypothetical protein